MSVTIKAFVLSILVSAATADGWWDDFNDNDDSSGMNNNVGDRFGRGDHNPRIWFNGRGGGGSNSVFAPPYSFNSFDLNKNYRKAARARIAHAALASAAFVFFFPVGAMAVRILPGRLALLVHVVCQFFAYLIFTVAFVLGIWMSLYVSTDDYKLIRLYHPIIGIVIFCLLAAQPLSGALHHLGFKRHGSRTGVSYLHIGLGRLLITLGIINGGLGLLLANNASRGQIAAYSVIAGLMWVLWMAVALLGEVRRRRELAKEAPRDAQGGPTRSPRGSEAGTKAETVRTDSASVAARKDSEKFA